MANAHACGAAVSGGRLFTFAAGAPAFCAALAMAVSTRGAPATPQAPVHESSIGGVVGASPLPGKAGDGSVVYHKWCAGCHAADYVPKNTLAGADRLSPVSRTPLGTTILRRRYQESVPAVLDERTDLTPDLIRLFVRAGVNAMPSFRKTEISEAELDAVPNRWKPTRRSPGYST